MVHGLKENWLGYLKMSLLLTLGGQKAEKLKKTKWSCFVEHPVISIAPPDWPDWQAQRIKLRRNGQSLDATYCKNKQSLQVQAKEVEATYSSTTKTKLLQEHPDKAMSVKNLF